MFELNDVRVKFCFLYAMCGVTTKKYICKYYKFSAVIITISFDR